MILFGIQAEFTLETVLNSYLFYATKGSKACSDFATSLGLNKSTASGEVLNSEVPTVSSSSATQ